MTWVVPAFAKATARQATLMESSGPRRADRMLHSARYVFAFFLSAIDLLKVET